MAQRPIEETASRPIGIVECVLLVREVRRRWHRADVARPFGPAPLLGDESEIASVNEHRTESK